jgi:3-oxoacid CoA-transferase subunit A
MIDNVNFKNWLIRGDCHGNFQWLHNETLKQYTPSETAIIILGDSGCNFWLNKTDRNLKRNIEQIGYTLYLVKGNHEARPETLPEVELTFDENVNNYVYIQPEFPHIRYFKQYGIYVIMGYKCLVLGGAYSVDKWYRLERVGMTEKTNIPTKSGWFADEQMTEDEMFSAYMMAIDNKFDFVFTHTCPLKFEPVDMFLKGIDQSKVDKRMEIWLDKMYDQIDPQKLSHTIWCWGHYHADRLEAPYCEMYYNDIEDLKNIIERWERYDRTKTLDWWLNRNPKFDVEVTR